MTTRELEEYRALRATIRERSTARVWVFLAGLIGWAALTIATAALAALPVATFLPLLILAATFEGVFSLHVAVETTDSLTVGRSVMDTRLGAAQQPNADVAFGADAKLLAELLLDVFTHHDSGAPA